MKQIESGSIDQEIEGSPEVKITPSFFKMTNTLPKSFKAKNSVKLSYSEMVEASTSISGELVKLNQSWQFTDEDDVFGWQMSH